jgi:cytochrome c biogenesis protein CcmG/thiol:disulfide interchange protein DsbE
MNIGRIIFCALITVGATAAQPAVTASIQPPNQRRPAPEFALKDGAGKTVSLKKYRGKIVLLDFWATWCHGCKEEIPWFAAFERKYSGKGLRVIGVSLDEEGWKAVRPFLAGADVPYCIVVGDEATTKKYAIENMPDTFLIDRKGKIAAAYLGLVDRNNIEANIQIMLSRSPH